MCKKKLVLLSVLAFVLTLVSLRALSYYSTGSLARVKFEQIEIGMTCQQVQELMGKTPQAKWARLECLDTWDFEDQSTMWVIFQPDCHADLDAVDKQDPEHDDWKVSNVILMEGGMTIRKLLIRIGLSSGSLELTKP